MLWKGVPMFDFLRPAPALFWLPGRCPGVLQSGVYEVEESDEIRSVVTVRKCGVWQRYFRTVDAAKRWCAEDAA